MSQRIYFLTLLTCLVTIPSFAKRVPEKIKKTGDKGKFYVFWGWNRSWYTNSNIHFKGNNYDFTLSDVVARDRQSPFDADVYFNPGTMTIPQTNLRIGYFFNDNWDISIAVDHMKYIMTQNQQTKITGAINDGTLFDGSYNNDDITLIENFLIFEHTDGLNYLNAELTHNQNLLDLLKLKSNGDKFQLDILFGAGAGVLLPKSNVKIWNQERHDDFHLAGYGIGAKMGINATFFKHFFIRSEFKSGFIHMPDIRTSPDPSDKASQHFFFSELVYSLGISFTPFN